MSVSLVLPCYNPPVGWEQNIVTNYRDLLQRTGTAIQLILVLDGKSPTVTGTSVQLLRTHIADIEVIAYDENRGKGYAIRQGVAKAQNDIVIYTDIDFPYSPASLYSIYDALRTKRCDVAIGVKNEQYYQDVPRVRRLISRYLQKMVRTFLSMPVTDTQCGLKGFNSSVAPLFLQTTIDRYLFDLEFVRNCFRTKNLRVQAIPVALNENVHFRRMNYRILFPEMVNFARLIFKRK